MKARKIHDGDIVCSIGDEPDCVHILYKGTIRVLDDKGAQLQTLSPGQVMGEFGFFSGALRTASLVVACREGLLFSLDQIDYARVTLRHRIADMGIISFLSEDKIKIIEPNLQVRRYQDGTYSCTIGQWSTFATTLSFVPRQDYI
jgi:CRP-like cAMP-binding protein